MAIDYTKLINPAGSADTNSSNSGTVNNATGSGIDYTKLRNTGNYNAALNLPSYRVSAGTPSVPKSSLTTNLKTDKSTLGGYGAEKLKAGIGGNTTEATAAYKTEKEKLNDKYLEAAYDVTDGIESAKAVDEQYKKTAEAGQKANKAEADAKAARYERVPYQYDFDTKASQGNANYNANADVMKAQNPGNKIRWADDNAEFIEQNANDTQKNVWTEEYQNLTYANDTERKTYNYILASEGNDAADEYLDYLRPYLNARAGQETAAEIIADTSSNKVGREVALGLMGGIEGGWQNVKQNFTDEALPQSANQYAGSAVQQDIVNRKGNGFSWEKALTQTASSLGNMIPSLAAGVINPAAGAIVGGATERGATYNELLNEGYSKEQADSVATISGVAAAISSYIIGGISAAGGKLTGITTDTVLSHISNAFAKGLTKLGIETVSETAEELLENKIKTLAENKFLGKNESLAFNQEDLDTVITTALMTAILQLPSAFATVSAPVNTEISTESGETKGVDGVKVDFSKIGTEILNNEDARTQFETMYGPIEGNSKTEQAKYITETLRNAAYQEQQAQQNQENTLNADIENISVEPDTHNNTVNAATQITNTVQQTQTQPTTVNPKTEGQIGAVMQIREMVRNGLSYSNASEIVSDTQLRQVFEDISGVTLSENKKTAKQQIVDYGKGKADVKVTPNLVEEEVSTYEGKHEGEPTQPRKFDKHGLPVYPKTHNKVNPVTESSNGVHEQTPYRGKHQAAEVETQEQNYPIRQKPEKNIKLRSNPALEITQNNAPTTAQAVTPSTNTETIAETPTEQSRQFTESAEGTSTINTIRPPVNENVTPTEKQGQSHSIEGLADASGFQYDGHTYITTPEVESLNTASARVRADMPAEIKNLGNKDAWTGTDVDTAMTITGSLMADAIENNSMDAVNAWIKVVEAHKTTSGKALQAWSKWAKGGQAVVLQMAKKGASAETVSEAQEIADRFDSIEDGDTASVKDIIKELNQKRGTGTIFKGLYDKLLDKQTDFDYLKEYALRQLSAYGADATHKADVGQHLKTWQSVAQLLRLTTTERNIGGNVSFGALDSLSQNGVAVGVDSLMSLIDGTGIHTVGFDKGLANKGAVKNYVTAFERSVLEVSGDVNMGKTSAYGNPSTRTNKMSGNILNKAGSRAEQLLGYNLNTTDDMASARTSYGVTQGLNAINNGKLSADQTKALADNITAYRLFKNNGKAKGLSQGMHDVVNIIGIGGEVEKTSAGLPKGRRGGFGAADAFGLSYPGVPANLGVKALEYSPLNVAKALFIDPINLAKTAKADGKTSTEYLVQRQDMAMDFARGVTGTALIAAMSALFKSGALKYYDDEDDYDVVTQNKAEGKQGTMVNLSAIERGLKGEDATEWRSDDRVMNIAWLQPINSLMAISYLMSKTMDSDEWDSMTGIQKTAELGKDIGVGAVKGLMDMPIMTFFSNVVDVYNSNRNTSEDAEESIGNAAGAFGEILGSAATGMIPGLVSQTAKATDEYQRDTSADTVLGGIKNSAMNSIPGLRENLPVKTDNYGNPIQNEDNTYDRVMNALVRPGTVTNIKQNDVSAEIERVSNAVGDTKIYPDRKAPSSFTIDGETYELDSQAQRAYKDLVGQTIEKLYGDFMNSSEYGNLDDSSRADVYKKLQSLAEAKAKAEYMKTQGIDDYENTYTKLVNGTDDNATVSEKNLAEYIAYDTALANADGDEKDYAAIDGIVGSLDKMPAQVSTALLERNSNLKTYKLYADGGIGSELYNKAKTSLGDVQDEENTDSDDSRILFKSILNMDANDEDKKKLFNFTYEDENGTTRGYLSKNWRNVYTILTKYGATPQQVYDFAVDADASATYNEATGQYDENKKTSNNVFTAYEIATELNRTNLPEETKEAIFNEFAESTGKAGRYDTGWSKNTGKNKWRKYTFKEASAYPASYTQGKYNMALNIAGGSTDYTSLRNPLSFTDWLNSLGK